MARQVFGNIQGLPPKQLKQVEKLAIRATRPESIIDLDLARELNQVSAQIKRKIALLINRQGRIEQVVVGTRELVYLPDLGRYRVGRGRLRRLRLIQSDLTKPGKELTIPSDLLIDLEKLRFDLVAVVKTEGQQVDISYAWNMPWHPEQDPMDVALAQDLSRLDFDFLEWISGLEQELESNRKEKLAGKNRCFVVGVYPSKRVNIKSRLAELRELARTADVNVVGEFTQVRKADPRTLIGKGKLEEILLEAIRPVSYTHLTLPTKRIV